MLQMYTPVDPTLWSPPVTKPLSFGYLFLFAPLQPEGWVSFDCVFLFPPFQPEDWVFVLNWLERFLNSDLSCLFMNNHHPKHIH